MTDDKRQCVIEDQRERDKLAKCWGKSFRDVAPSPSLVERSG